MHAHLEKESNNGIVHLVQPDPSRCILFQIEQFISSSQEGMYGHATVLFFFLYFVLIPN